MSMYGRYEGIDGPLDVKDWPVTDCTGDKGFTVQSDREEADINKIVQRFVRTGQLPPTRGGEPFYGDVSDIGDLQDALIKVQEADELFKSYPAHIRERFGNDPVQLIEFLEDVNNRPEALELGLIQAPVKGTDPVPNPPPAASADAPKA